MNSLTLQPNATLQGGKYTIKKVLGQGGFGITYLAEHNLLGTKVAIKEFFMKELNNREESTSQVSVGSEGSRELVMKFRDKFIKEARNIARLNHPNIIRIHDVFEENGTAYYVMEYCEGESLNELLKMHPMGLGEAMAVKYIRQVASALQYIHERKMNHLDVKPANIMLNVGNAVLIDFGLSKQYDSTGSQTSTTPVGISHGFAPIEQYKQGGVSEFSPATDIYSLGATLFKLITGQTPPDAQTLIEEDLPMINATAPVANAIRQAMQVKRGNRPQSIAAWLQLLDSSAKSSIDDESTQVLQPAWQEEEDRRRKAQAEKERKEKEEEERRQREKAKREMEERDRRIAEERAARQAEAKRHAEEVERLSLEAEKKRLAEEKERLAQQRKEQELAAKKNSSKALYIVLCIIAVIIAIVYFTNNNSSASYNDYSSNQNTTQEQQTPQSAQSQNVTHEEFCYQDGTIAFYWTGNLNDGLPDGFGLIEYPANDPDKRYEYRGKVVKGNRVDANATLTYRNGNSYTGSFENDNFSNGKLVLKNDGVYFQGTFRNNNPYNGTWYFTSDNSVYSKVVKGVEEE